MFSEDEFLDILGPSPTETSNTEKTSRGPGRPPGSKNKKPSVGTTLSTASLNEVMTGVPIPFLVQVFRMGRQTVQERLKPLNPIKHGNNGAPYYDLQRAAEYLIDPKIDLPTYLKSLSPEDLPDQLRDNYWSAKLKRQKWETNAGELWHSEDVKAVFGEIFRIIKTRTNLVADTVEKKKGLSPEQREMIGEILDGMLGAIRQEILDQTTTKRTVNQLGHEDDV